VVDVVAVPDRLEDGVAEPEDEEFCTVSLPR